MTHWFLRPATLYGVVGIGLGLYMSATNDFAWHPVHAHLNLLGWVTLALFGLFYRSHPHAAAGKLATRTSALRAGALRPDGDAVAVLRRQDERRAAARRVVVRRRRRLPLLHRRRLADQRYGSV